MSDLVLDASLTLQWFLEDESGRDYSLRVLSSLSGKRAAVPPIWLYEVGNGLLMAFRRKRISADNMSGFLVRLAALPIDVAAQSPTEVLELPRLAVAHGLTNYDAACLDIAMRASLPLATTDDTLRRAAAATGVKIVAP